MIGIAKTAEDRNEYGYPNAHIVANEKANQTTNVDQSVNKALPWLVMIAIVSCSISGVSLGLAIGARDLAKQAEREARLQRLETDEMNVRLAIAGIPKHQPGDKP